MSGAASGLGVVVAEHGLAAALRLPNAQAAALCIFDGDREVFRAEMARDDAGVLRGLAPGFGVGARYGFRVEGPYDPAHGHRFDASKLLADPYAWAFDRPFRLHPSMFSRGEDSGPHAPKAIAGGVPAGEPGRKRVAPELMVIYELNLRGFSRLNPAVPEEARGTFAGLAHPASIAHLARLGVTAVEIMPAAAFVDERHLPPLGLSNAWGYNPVVFGAPDPRLSPGGWAEVRAATDALHAAGMEAILDVVLNHTGESDEFGPTLSFRGLDNAAFFRLDPRNPALYVNDTGCGNCVALDRPLVVEIAIAAMRRWVICGGFDGFRFDLATCLGRNDHGFDPNGPFFQALAADPLLRGVRLIAEPWDVGPGGYRLGAFRSEFAEWNDKFRDAARRFWRGDPGLRGEIATRMAGSRDVFPAAPAPSKSVNFVAAHDGFTLADLVAYERKHNEANGERNRDGTDVNFSWNHGVEGPSDDHKVQQARRRDERNLLTLLLSSRGTPMLAMGAELGFSQNGNNNAYAQDNATTAIRWGEADASLIEFTRRLIGLRRAHPALSRDAFLTGKPFNTTGLPDVEWRSAHGVMTEADWSDPAGAVLLAVFAAAHAEETDRVAVAMNRSSEDIEIALPSPRPDMAWRILADTNDPEAPEASPPLADRLRLKARTCTVLAERLLALGRQRSRPPTAAQIDTLAQSLGIAPEWWDVAGNRAVVSADTKIALIAALGLAAGSEAQARDSLAYVLDATERRTALSSLVALAGAPLAAPLRGRPNGCEARLEFEDGSVTEWRVEAGEGARRELIDGSEVEERWVPLPSLPVGRHKLLLGDVPCALIVAPRETYVPEGAHKKRFGVTAQLYALRRTGDQGIGDFSALGEAGQRAGRAGAAYLGVSPMHMLFPHDRERASPYHPSDRRFLDPILIDAFDADLPRDGAADAVLAALAPTAIAPSAARLVDYPAVWTLKRAALEALHAAFARAAEAAPQDPVVAEHRAFVAAGGETLRRFAMFQAVADGEAGPDWRSWPSALREGEASAVADAVARSRQAFDFALFCQWLADRQFGRAAISAGKAGLAVGFYRDIAVGAAPDGAEAWANASVLAKGVEVGAPPDPFSTQGQNWRLPAPNPLAEAGDGWLSRSRLFAANMRHAGMLRIDHAMGLQRLFLIPEGATPADGAYLAYPLDDLVGVLALESHRAQCMVVGEDLGTVAEGFRERMTRADIHGMRVLWFERKDGAFLPPAGYPPKSVACVSTHDLPTLAGWWRGADIAERLSLGLMNLTAAGEAIAERRREKLTLIAALRATGALSATPDEDAALDDMTAAAVHAFVAAGASVFAHAQYDDLVGETVSTNLPGTDRERANWRLKVGPDLAEAFASVRARAILAALAKGRT